jgi:hypothetical protein
LEGYPLENPPIDDFPSYKPHLPESKKNICACKLVPYFWFSNASAKMFSKTYGRLGWEVLRVLKDVWDVPKDVGTGVSELHPVKRTYKQLKLVGGFTHLEKYESQWEGLSHILWKIKNDPNHQPAKHHITISSLNHFSADQFALVFFIRVAPLQMVLSGHGRYNGIQRKCLNGP